MMIYVQVYVLSQYQCIYENSNIDKKKNQLCMMVFLWLLVFPLLMMHSYLSAKPSF